jgi:hypothetical protein
MSNLTVKILHELVWDFLPDLLYISDFSPHDTCLLCCDNEVKICSESGANNVQESVQN